MQRDPAGSFGGDPQLRERDWSEGGRMEEKIRKRRVRAAQAVRKDGREEREGSEGGKNLHEDTMGFICSFVYEASVIDRIPFVISSKVHPSTGWCFALKDRKCDLQTVCYVLWERLKGAVGCLEEPATSLSMQVCH